ncbi:hypothetical protein CEUSTIGMA_g8812.t1 [Chlamydomonas eustigma]|uniref:tRNA-dihydrouridine(16/17) synthase [NAD(P)(+)] n=1 Tax=Chlamydomonas eustigma TaxID=1157962 RepID=A0A250XEA4_9CHLO|nr:hypothetical protein CEUSTIGMA_g8812.t1 [Chlamydomonas eustigma]|eukprot:GAX81381.1 hypothetical protein CEUSTIGMA_g8812.t1 [Chlamydomonas eustigma]
MSANVEPAIVSVSCTDSGKQVVAHAERSWAFFKSMGSPKYHVAPMVDQSELPFRLLCRDNGASCAYSPMMHARLFAQDPKYRADIWSTCKADRPLLAQFCANDPNYLVQAAKLIQHECDMIDINFGCPQRIAKRGFYGAFLMDDLELIEQLIIELTKGVSIPVSCKIRIFPELEKTLAYARMVERAGCSLLAVHGRTRDQKDNSGTRADWNAIKAVKQALSIPVLANGNIRNLQDANECMAYTGCDGVLSAESLLVDPALFSPSRIIPGNEYNAVSGVGLLRDYLGYAIQYPVAMRMVKGHVHKLIGPWLSEHHDLRDKVNCGGLSLQGLIDEVVKVLDVRIKESGRTYPVPKLSERALKRLEKEAAIKAAIEEQKREEEAVAALDEKVDSVTPGTNCDSCDCSLSQKDSKPINDTTEDTSREGGQQSESAEVGNDCGQIKKGKETFEVNESEQGQPPR